MPSRRITFPALAVLVIASLALGVLAALADGRDPRPAVVVAVPRPVPVPAGRIAVASARVLRALRPIAYAPCTPAAKDAPAPAPVPQSLLDAFGVLRRDATPDDQLPATALDALRDRGLEPFDPAAARLLRRTDAGGRAWVVPVRDVGDQGIVGLRCALPAAVLHSRAARKRLRPARVPLPVTPAPAATVPSPPTPARPAPRPGLAVVALDGAPAGAGGRLEDLVRGREAVAIDPCGGPNRDMLSVSGIVPDGVGAAFLTSPDGTAVRADVTGNAYAFVVPRASTPEARYVVWTGGDGTPHVQPLGSPVFVARARCATTADRQPPTVSPDGSGLCGHFFRTTAFAVPTTPGSRRTRYLPTTPVPLLDRAPCAIATPSLVLPTVRIAPARPRAPKKHG